MMKSYKRCSPLYAGPLGAVRQQNAGCRYAVQHNFGDGDMNPSFEPVVSDAQAVVEAVRRHIQNRQPGGITLDVLTDGVRQDQDWWYVPVRPSAKPPRRYEYYETLAAVENELQESEHLTVLLVPAEQE